MTAPPPARYTRPMGRLLVVLIALGLVVLMLGALAALITRIIQALTTLALLIGAPLIAAAVAWAWSDPQPPANASHHALLAGAVVFGLALLVVNGRRARDVTPSPRAGTLRWTLDDPPPARPARPSAAPAPPPPPPRDPEPAADRAIAAAWRSAVAMAPGEADALAQARRHCAALLHAADAGSLDMAVNDAAALIRNNLPDIVADTEALCAEAPPAERRAAIAAMVNALEQMAAHASEQQDRRRQNLRERLATRLSHIAARAR